VTKRVLVIGAGGFIGQSLCQALRKQGAIVKAVSRNSCTPGLTGIEWIRSDCHSHLQLAGWLRDTDAVVFLAAGSTPGSSAGKPVAELSNNLAPLLATLEALQQLRDVPLVYFSSAGALYGDSSAMPSREADIPEPRSYHGAAKVAAEQFIGAWTRQYGGAATIIRPSNVYGPGQTEKMGFGIIPAMLGCIQRGETLNVWGDGSVARDYLYIDDLIGLTLAALNHPSHQTVRTLNAASGVSVTLNELFTLAEEATGRPLRRNYENIRTVDARRVSIDAGMAKEHLHWQATVPLLQGLKRTWLWLNTSRL
jgi:UDP-glucose 4-epimerase